MMWKVRLTLNLVEFVRVSSQYQLIDQLISGVEETSNKSWFYELGVVHTRQRNVEDT